MSSSFQDLSDWVIQVTGCEKPKDATSIEWLRDGIVLCTLLEKLQPGILEHSKINREKDSMPFGWIENIGLYLQTCKKIGLHPDDLFVTADLFQNRDPQLVFRNITAVCVWARNIPAVKTRMLSRNQTQTQDKSSISPQDQKALKRKSAGDIYLASSPPPLGTSMPNLMAFCEDESPSHSPSVGKGDRSSVESPRPVPAAASVNSSEMDDLWDQIKNLKKKMLALEVANDSLSQDKDDLQKQLDEKEGELQKHQTALDGNKESLAQVESLQKQLVETKATNSTLVSRVEELEVRLQKMEFERQNLEIERKILESEKQHVMKHNGLSKSTSHDSSLSEIVIDGGSPSGRSGRSFTIGSVFGRRGSVKDSPKTKKSGSPLTAMFGRKKSTPDSK